MSREIKFRAWHMPFGPKGPMQEMVHGKASSILAFAKMSPDEYIVEQYTGLKDANGKDIYEGDVVHGYDQEPDRDDGYIGSSVIEVVNFKWGSFWLGDFKNRIMLYTPPIIEVIGNVHTNPELLEAQHDTRID